jgi:DNA topoisomerase VI subunit B
MPRLERTTFEASRAAEFFDARKLATLTGVGSDDFASVVLKELIDNSLDACESAGVKPQIDVHVPGGEDDFNITVQDNGPGIPSEVVRKVKDYSISVSDKAAYRSPTRGAQGNAWKTIIGMPYALGSRRPLTVVARGGVKHTIEPSIDPAGQLRIAHEETNGQVPDTGGTRVEVPICLPLDNYFPQDFDPLHWVRSFAIFNPHADVTYQGMGTGAGGPVFYKSTVERVKKCVPSEPTSPHWYSPESLKVLVFSHIADAQSGGNDLPVGTFVRQFAGLSSSAKAKAVLSAAALPEIKHLSDFQERPEAVGDLLEGMKQHSKEPKASTLGWVGQDHFRMFFERIYTVNEFKYVRKSSTLPSGLPFTFEFALATLEEPGHLYCGINFSPTFGDPLEGTTLAGPEFRAGGIRGFLNSAFALPQEESAWHRSPTSVAVAAHIITPAPIFLDRGKTRLNMEGA